jgi:hypothetical protein
MYETMLNCPRGNSFVWSSLIRKASLSQWRSLLAQCEREAFIIYRLLAKIYHLGC